MCKLVEIENSEKNMVRVAEIKKDCILNVIHSCELCPDIHSVVLFGSGVREDCSVPSDVDIAVFGDKSKAKMFKSSSYRKFVNSVCSCGELQDYDILYFDRTKVTDSLILDNIAQGVVLYKRAQL